MTRAVRVPERAVDRDRGVPRVDFVAGGVARRATAATSWMSSAVSCFRASWNSVRSMTAFSAQTGVELGDFRRRFEHNPVNGVFPGSPTPTPCGRAGAFRPGCGPDRRGCRPRTPASRRTRTRARSRRARPRRRRSRRRAPARGRGCARAVRRFSVASVRNTSSAASRVSRKWWIRSGSYSGMPCSTAATVVTVPARPTSVSASRCPGDHARRPRRRGRAPRRPRSTAPRARADPMRGTAR